MILHDARVVVLRSMLWQLQMAVSKVGMQYVG